MLLSYHQAALVEVGTDEAGRGCLAGAVFAAAVILPPDYKNIQLDDSKKLSAKQRAKLRQEIEQDAIEFAVSQVNEKEIDTINILQASILAMHHSLAKLTTPFGYIIADGNRFKPFQNIPHKTIIKGDGLYLSIAAASILAKTYRDEYMEALHLQYPQYGWLQNKGYATKAHRDAIIKYGYCDVHRKSFVLKELIPDLFVNTK